MAGLKFNIIRFDNLPSTQLYLNHSASENQLEEGTLILAANQQAGIGQDKNQWESEAGNNLTFSFLIRPVFLEPANQFMLTKMVSLAILHCLQKSNNWPDPLSVKWPNDIYAGSKKLAGILISNAIMGNILEYSIIGIGLNVNQSTFPAYCPNPASIFTVTGKENDTEQVLTNLLSSIQDYYRAMYTTPALLDQQYLDNLYQAGQWKTYEVQGHQISGKIIGTDEYGRLLLETEGNEIRIFDLKEVKFL